MSTIFEKGKQNEYSPSNPEQIFWIDYQKGVQPGDIIKADRVLKHGTQFGQPALKGITVKLEVVGESSEKTVAVKYKAKKRYKVKRGCRIQFTKVRVVGIEEAK